MNERTLAELLAGDVVEVAPKLLGSRLTSEVDGERTAVLLIEVEAYGPDDPASHSYRGRTRRNRSMFGRPGTLYVYRSYGVHWCANVVTGPTGTGSAVLLRGGRPVEGREVMERRRGRSDHLTDGPGRLTQALGITGEHDGIDLLSRGGIRLETGEHPGDIATTGRIGISRGVEHQWRFVAAGPGPDTNLADSTRGQP